ncbi:acetoacetate--CoA ligase [Aeromicrobium phragmitis]|uniref:Acetoacetate--CoA ligase n=1 Tax=Aeromicrobium phragmitis TaxID=2478914 RepID=A0A3L8PQ64_9ACTN|nr:acetoacetate--CoA ligase [Aeromicrobium phragmitis]RLV57460.1 acetoacetate--CoA ligase [Aeromicrobium phragmitis]
MTAPVLWSPPLDGSSQMEGFMRWLSAESIADVPDYERLWQWSVDEPDSFWAALWRYFDIPSDGDASVALSEDVMPGAVWFPHVRVNYAEAMVRMPGRADDDVVVLARSQSREDIALTAAQFRDQVARARAGLLRAGVSQGDRVAAYAPNVPETLVLLLASASLGAVFTSCAPEFGTQSVVDRWQQIEPTLLLTVDGYRYGTKPIDRRQEVDAIRAALPSVRTTVWLPYLEESGPVPEGATTWADFTAEPGALDFVRLPFAAPLYILFSSGTTGLPKPIVHGHGGITIEHLKALALHCDLGPRDRFFWFSTTGWMMWNFLVSGLGTGATIVMVDGDPASPDLGALWRMADELDVTYFGTSAPFLLQCRKEGVHPRQLGDLRELRAVGSTGAPLPAEGFRWAHDEFGPDVQICSVSGGTDVCAAFVGSAPIVPVYAGEISCRCLGCAVDAVDPDGKPVRDQLGELVVTRPMPSMPVGFWGDPDGSRYRAAYFENIPGVWRHGDWIRITEYGSCVITGRSDATLNRGGVRLGTSEFYSVVESLPEVADSLVVHLEDDEGGAGRLLLFVATADGSALDEDLRQRIRRELRSRLSPRHVPDEIHQVRAAPRTLSGKKLEVPVKKILRGTPVDDAAARGALQNPEVLDDYTGFSSGGTR